MGNRRLRRQRQRQRQRFNGGGRRGQRRGRRRRRHLHRGRRFRYLGAGALGRRAHRAPLARGPAPFLGAGRVVGVGFGGGTTANGAGTAAGTASDAVPFVDRCMAAVIVRCGYRLDGGRTGRELATTWCHHVLFAVHVRQSADLE